MESIILVFAEHKRGELCQSTLEMLCEARVLANKQKCQVAAVVLGANLDAYTDDLVAYGADKVCQFVSNDLDNFSVDLYTESFAVAACCGIPKYVFISSTPDGAYLAPYVAAKQGWKYAANVIKMAVQPDGSVQINRSVCADKAHGTFIYKAGEPIVITMKPGILGIGKSNRRRQGEVVRCSMPEDVTTRTVVEGYVKADPATVSLSEAEFVLAIGQGLRSKEDLPMIEELGSALGAAIGSSKPLADCGWLPHSRMVGQSSGRKLSPNLFVACGVSGATHFTEGMKDSRLIITVNNDKGAPISKIADLAVVGDMYEIIPELIKQLREAKGE